MSQANNLSVVPGNANQSGGSSLVLPSEKTLLQATKLALKTKKPVCFYFYIDSLKGKISIVSDGEDRVIFKNEDEHTSPILNTYLHLYDLAFISLCFLIGMLVHGEPKFLIATFAFLTICSA